MKLLLSVFQDILVAHGCKVEDSMAEDAMADWTFRKKIAQKDYSGMLWQERWSVLFKDWQDESSNLLHFLEIVQAIPFAVQRKSRRLSRS